MFGIGEKVRRLQLEQLGRCDVCKPGNIKGRNWFEEWVIGLIFRFLMHVI